MSDEERKNLKSVLEAAKLEIERTVSRVDTLEGHELSALKGAAHSLAAFVDFNSGCGKGLTAGAELMTRLRG